MNFREERFASTDVDVRFYWQIMTPREEWPDGKYGWLKDYVSVVLIYYIAYTI